MTEEESHPINHDNHQLCLTLWH